MHHGQYRARLTGMLTMNATMIAATVLSWATTASPKAQYSEAYIETTIHSEFESLSDAEYYPAFDAAMNYLAELGVFTSTVIPSYGHTIPGVYVMPWVTAKHPV